MKQRIMALFGALCLTLAGFGFSQSAAAAAGAGLSNFSKNKAAYTAGQFSDVDENAWYGTNHQGTIKKIIELGVMSGTGGNQFNPTGNITVAQAIKMASVVHNIYSGGNGIFTQGNPWYQVYIDYALENHIIKKADFSDYNTDITHAQMAYVFANAVPESALGKINTVENVPDVSVNTEYASDILLLYRAGVLMGSDEFGSFSPSSKAQRCQAAAIITRIAVKSERQTFELKPALSKTDAGQGLVYDQYTNHGTYTDGIDETCDYSYHVPAVNLDSADATAINAEIKSYCMNDINEALSEMKENYGPEIDYVNYSAYENGNILSLLIQTKWDYDFTDIAYKVYNINQYTGHLISNGDLAAYKGVREDTLLNTAKTDMGAKFKEIWGSTDCTGTDWMGTDLYQTQYNKTVSSDNVTMNMPMFVDGDGTINLVATIYSLVEADSYEYIVDTGL